MQLVAQKNHIYLAWRSRPSFVIHPSSLANPSFIYIIIPRNPLANPQPYSWPIYILYFMTDEARKPVLAY